METEEIIERRDDNNATRLTVSLRYGDLEAEFAGSPAEVGRLVNEFLTKEVPSYALAQKLSLKYSTAELVQNFSNYLKITDEGPVVIANGKLSDKQVLALRLVGQEIAFETGSSNSNSLNLSELQNSIPLKPKTISSRLSELTKTGNVVREEKNGTTSFRITTIGVASLLENLTRKTRASGRG
jgi:hypothetical protein